MSEPKSEFPEITFLGQCGFKITFPTLTIAIDPCLNDLTENGSTIRLYPPVMEPEDLKAHYIFCTHDHIDHIAEETVSRIAENSPYTKFIIPSGCREFLNKLGVPDDRIITLNHNQTKTIEDTITVKGISTAHPVHQVDQNGQDHNLAYSIKINGIHLVHLGDTYHTQQLENDLLSLEKIHIFFPPINGMDDIRAKAGIIGNLSISEAADLTAKLKPQLTIPTHFDMVKGNTADPEEFVRQLKRVSSNLKTLVLKA